MLVTVHGGYNQRSISVVGHGEGRENIQSGHPESIYEYLQNRILYREYRYQIFSFDDIERGVFPHEGYYEPVARRS
jgi:hypothetical protein